MGFTALASGLRLQAPGWTLYRLRLQAGPSPLSPLPSPDPGRGRWGLMSVGFQLAWHTITLPLTTIPEFRRLRVSPSSRVTLSLSLFVLLSFILLSSKVRLPVPITLSPPPVPLAASLLPEIAFLQVVTGLQEGKPLVIDTRHTHPPQGTHLPLSCHVFLFTISVFCCFFHLFFPTSLSLSL